MIELSGDKIEHLLWEAGCEVVHSDGKEEVCGILVPMGDVSVVLEDAYFLEGEWYLDDGSSITKQIQGVAVDSSPMDAPDEESLVQEILEFGGVS